LGAASERRRDGRAPARSAVPFLAPRDDVGISHEEKRIKSASQANPGRTVSFRNGRIKAFSQLHGTGSLVDIHCAGFPVAHSWTGLRAHALFCDPVLGRNTQPLPRTTEGPGTFHLTATCYQHISTTAPIHTVPLAYISPQFLPHH
jgi:hypothetical protein